MGVALAAVQAWPTMSPALKLLLTTGLLGGLTTFSTFSAAEAFHLLQRGAIGWLGAHLVVHVAGSVLMAPGRDMRFSTPCVRELAAQVWAGSFIFCFTPMG